MSFLLASSSEQQTILLLCPHKSLSCCAYRCYVDDKVSKVAWLNRSNIIFAGQDKWSLDPRVDLVTKGQLEYSLRIQKVTRVEYCPHNFNSSVEIRRWFCFNILASKIQIKFHETQHY